MIATNYFPFFWEQTGLKIERETRQVVTGAPADSLTVRTIIFNDLARIVDITNTPAVVDEKGKQLKESYCIYLDRSLAGVIKEGDFVAFNNSLLGQNVAFTDDKTTNITKGYIRRVVIPQAGSQVGSLECYIVSNN